jgi:hypothetical protein
MAVIRAALADASRYWQLRWAKCHRCSPGRVCATHLPGDAVARSYRELAARLSPEGLPS